MKPPDSAPSLPEAWQAYCRGDHLRAAEICRQAVAVNRGRPEALNLLGAIAHQAGQLDTAIAQLRQAVEAEPGNAQYHNNLGIYYTHASRLAEALASFRQAIALQPRLAPAYSNLSYAYYQLGQCEEARDCCEQALRLQPNLAEAHNHLGLALMELGQPEDAAAHFQRALELRPAFVGARRNLGVAWKELGRLAESAACLTESLRQQPQFADACSDLSEVLKQQGHLEEAAARLREALQINPHSALAYYNLSQMATQGFGSVTGQDLDHIHSMLKSSHVSLLDRSVLHLTLATVFEGQGRFDAAFSHAEQAGVFRKQWLRATKRDFDPAAHRALVDALIANFDEAFFRHAGPPVSTSELPVLVIGMPRSGTTLVEQILSCHSQVAGAGELNDVAELVVDLSRSGEHMASYPGCIRSTDHRVLFELAERYRTRLAQIGGSAIRVIDKMPANFLQLGFIAMIFPQARVIHCRRDALDVCLSCFFQNFRKVPYSWSLDDLGTYYREYERLMTHWKRVLPLRLMDVSYEDLVSKQHDVSRKLVEFCGLDWEDRCLAFHKNPRPVRTSSSVQVRQPMYNTSVGRWKRYARHLQPLRQALASG